MVLLENLTVTQLVKKFSAFYVSLRFITVFTRVRHWSITWAKWIQSTLSHPCFVRYILISSHLRLGLPSCRLPSGFPIKPLYAFSSHAWYEDVSKSSQIGRLEGELQMVQLSATSCRCIAILWVSQSSELCHHSSLCCFSTRVCCCKHIFRYIPNPETFWHTLVTRAGSEHTIPVFKR